MVTFCLPSLEKIDVVEVVELYGRLNGCLHLTHDGQRCPLLSPTVQSSATSQFHFDYAIKFMPFTAISKLENFPLLHFTRAAFKAAGKSWCLRGKFNFDFQPISVKCQNHPLKKFVVFFSF
jgi:hypothetical protein